MATNIHFYITKIILFAVPVRTLNKTCLSKRAAGGSWIQPYRLHSLTSCLQVDRSIVSIIKSGSCPCDFTITQFINDALSDTNCGGQCEMQQKASSMKEKKKLFEIQPITHSRCVRRPWFLAACFLLLSVFCHMAATRGWVGTSLSEQKISCYAKSFFLLPR